MVGFAVEGGPHQSCHHSPISNIDVETRDLYNRNESCNNFRNFFSFQKSPSLTVAQYSWGPYC